MLCFALQVSTGEEGYRSDGPTDGLHNNWINGGRKGVNFINNTNLPTIDFATIHCYPDNWEIQAYEYDQVNTNFIADRAAIAHRYIMTPANKWHQNDPQLPNAGVQSCCWGVVFNKSG